ncbi:SPOR domain-containing protein [Pseudopedobacter beijingensis]|uniref:SPOR domain-containing protein n=1 Tax=Pseudopedobacter beijingensis TaxID=1207056 RepID=A0ABW4I9Z3_9SPHI
MLKIKQSIVGLFLGLCIHANAQEKGSVEEIKDPRIDNLIEKRIELTKGASNTGAPLVINGFRVQIFFGPDRREVYDQQAKFKSLYPEYNTYISYTQPNYRLKVGDFRTRIEAQQLVNDLKPIFPTLFIFNEKINPTKVDQ